jgi:hypothetical protein
MGRLDTERGPVLRVFEFDRYNGTVWQVDMMLSNGSFVAHPRILNPTDVDLRGYWWTCVAVDAEPSTRIFTPATHVAETSRDPMRTSPWPVFAEAIENASFHGYQDAWPTDNSYLGNHQIGDMFLRLPADEIYQPYIGHNQEGDKGYTLIHGHPLNGTKFYTWGQSGPGRFMQDFLAGGGKRQGDYTELQVGPAPTQMQNFAVPKQSQQQWTEWFKGFYGDEAVLRGEDYDAALQQIDSWMRSDAGMPKSSVGDLDAFFVKLADRPVDEMLVQGQPWGALEEALLGRQITPGLTFSLPKKGDATYEEAQPWMELLQDGTFSKETLSRLPISYQTTDRWLQKLEESAEKHGMTWLHALHIAIGHIERGAVSYPLELLAQSMALKPNPIAARCIAVLQTTPQAAWPFWQLAWQVAQTDFAKDGARQRITLNLVTEISFFLQQELWYEEMASFAQTVLDGNYLGDMNSDAFMTMRIKTLLHNNQNKDALDILGANCFPTYAKARDDLMNMWNQAVMGVAAQSKGSPLTYVEQHQARVSHPIPDNIGCQYASEVSLCTG